MSCVVQGCRSHTSRPPRDGTTNTLVSFHRFPKDENLKTLWLKQIARRNFTLKSHTRICSKHFTMDSFICVNYKWRRLKNNAVPTLNLSEADYLMDIHIKDEPGLQSTSHLQAFHQNLSEAQHSSTTVPQYQFSQKLIDPLTINVPKEIIVPTKKCPEKTWITFVNGDGTLNHDKKVKELETEVAMCKSKICLLEHQLSRAKILNQRRLRKINALTKRISRTCKKLL